MSTALRALLLLFGAMLSLPGAALTPFEESLNPAQQERYRALIHQLRCLVCQNQTIADSDAELAEDLRRQVHDRILDGQSDAQIKAYVTERYGDFVLYRPPLAARTLVLWIGPGVLVLIGLGVVWRFSRAPKTKPSDDAVDPDRLKRLLDEDL